MGNRIFTLNRLSRSAFRERMLRDSSRRTLLRHRTLQGQDIKLQGSKLVELAEFSEHGPEGCHFLDMEGTIHWVNTTWARMTGYSKEELVGKKYTDLIPPDERRDAEDRRKRKLRGETVPEIMGRTYITKDGRPLFISSRDVVIKDHSGKIRGTKTILFEVSRLRLLEAQRHQLKMREDLGHLAEGFAHEFNNLSAAIFLAVQQIRKHNSELKPQTTQLLDIIEEQCLRTKELTEGITTYVRLKDVHFSRLEPQNIAKQVVRMMENTKDIRLKSVKYELELSNTFEINAGEAQIFQALLNLCINARDALKESGTIQISIRDLELEYEYRACTGQKLQPGKYVVIKVKDDGEGISADIQEIIFVPFFTTKDPQKGTGLGLPTVLGIVDSHGGGIDFKSASGKGAEFKLYLPAAKTEQPS